MTEADPLTDVASALAVFGGYLRRFRLRRGFTQEELAEQAGVIELAAGRAGLLSAEEIVRPLDRRLTLLTNGPLDVPARQQTLHRTLEWSYERPLPTVLNHRRTWCSWWRRSSTKAWCDVRTLTTVRCGCYSWRRFGNCRSAHTLTSLRC